MTTRKPSHLQRLVMQSRQVVLRDEIREKILQGIEQHLSTTDPNENSVESSARRARWRSLGWGAVAAVAVGCSLLVWGLRRPEKLDLVVSTVYGQAFSEGAGTRMLSPNTHVSEGQWLRTSAASAMETKVGGHTVAVSADSNLLLESLKAKELKFRLERGGVTLTVSPLSPGKRLRVFAGDLSVEVVGTVFTVKRDGGCSSVSVRSGRVATGYKGMAGVVSAGEERRFCPPSDEKVAMTSLPSQSKAEVQVPEAAEETVMAETLERSAPQRSIPDLPLPSRRGRSRTMPPAGTPVPQAEVLSDEERLFRAASRSEGDASARIVRLQEYLARFPNGMFTEEALFQLIRNNYAAAAPAQVIHFADQFLQQFHGGRRTSEVQLLYLQSRIEMGQPPSQSLGVLESLLSHLDSLPRNQREQATYLAILTYCGSSNSQACRPWIHRYLEQYPNGFYADRIRRSLSEKIQNP